MNNKKVLIPVIVILAVAILAGGYWAWQRYEQERLARQFLSGLAGLGSGNPADLQKLGNLANEYAGAVANETGGTSGGEEAQTPEQQFNATEEVQVDSTFVNGASSEIEPIIKEVFGNVKISGFFNNYFGEGSGLVQFKIPREAASGDLNKLNSAFTAQGYTIVTSGIDSGSGSVAATKNNTQYMLTFDVGSQDVTVIIVPESQ